MSYDRYVTKLNNKHEAMVRIIPSVPLRSYIRRYMKRVLNEIVTANKEYQLEEKRGRKAIMKDLKDKVAFNEMLVKAIEDHLKGRIIILEEQ